MISPVPALHRILCFNVEGALDNSTSTEKGNAIANEEAQEKLSEPQQVISPSEEQAEVSGLEVNEAAVIIQAKTQTDAEKVDSEKAQEGSQQEVDESESKCVDMTSDEVADIDVDDPKLNKAASVIQANFRTYLSKKANEERQPEIQTEMLEANIDSEPQEATELSKEDEKTEAIPQNEANQDKPESENSVDPEMTITHSGSQNYVIQEDTEGTKSQSIPDEEQLVEETEEESSKATEPQPPTQDQQVEETEEESPKDTEQSPTQDKEERVEGTEEDGSRETEPQPTQDESEPLPEESKKEDENGELASTSQSQHVAGSDVPEGAPVENQIEPTGGDEQGATEV